MWTERPLTDSLFFHLCGEILATARHRTWYPIITMEYRVRCEVCRAVDDQIKIAFADKIEAAINQELDS